MRIHAGRAERELVHLQFAHEYRARVGELLGHRGVVIGNEVTQNLRADGRADALGEVEVFQADRNAVQRPPVLATGYLPLRSLRTLRSLFGKERYECVQSGLCPLDPVKMRPRQFHGGKLPRLYQARGLGDRQEAEFVGVH